MTANSLMASTWSGMCPGAWRRMRVSSNGAYRRVLVGFDGSPDAAEALRFGVAMCDGGELVVLCVIQRVLPAGANGEGSDGAGLRAQAQGLLGELAHGALPGRLVRASVQVMSSGGDSPGNVVTGYAGEHGFDLLVLGRHGAGGRRKSMLGRVAERAARACPVPLLLLSAPGRDARIQALRGDASSGLCLGAGQARW
jgi:nucleotide-binding universal stress UspA family protein